ncbi:MAG: dephospho-CoA kinase [SAR86 cluster bacterium]|uniref:Dephospho-CoA kinase n=1 Tax=SAR86 cluster bacterium TaxID=2030880 RepID=A0A2A5AYR5_9GAMM|nr:MAG: dephospho-CoA kinase [SAR86 cluster bacterium]
MAEQKSSTYVVGLTGGIGSGKSTVAAIFQSYGIDVINADSLSREVVVPGSPALEKIAEHFGADIISTDGELDRQRLRQIIFSDNTQKTWLEKLLHPLISELMKNRLENASSTYCILESPLLLETKQHELVNRVLVIDVSEQTQLQRTLKRDQSDSETVQSIIKSQISRELRLQKADDILANEADPQTLHNEVDSLHKQYLTLAKSS